MKATTVLLFLLAVTAALMVAGCSQQQTAPVTTMTPPVTTMAAPVLNPPPLSDTIGVSPSPLGVILVDARGMTLYYFANDAPASGISTCNGQCAVNWPPFSPGAVLVPSTLNPDDFGMIQRADGTKQAAYLGRPLYYYSGDTKPGDTRGQGINSLWFVADATRKVPLVEEPVILNTLSPTGGGTDSGGY